MLKGVNKMKKKVLQKFRVRGKKIQELEILYLDAFTQEEAEEKYIELVQLKHVKHGSSHLKLFVKDLGVSNNNNKGRSK